MNATYPRDMARYWIFFALSLHPLVPLLRAREKGPVKHYHFAIKLAYQVFSQREADLLHCVSNHINATAFEGGPADRCKRRLRDKRQPPVPAPVSDNRVFRLCSQLRKYEPSGVVTLLRQIKINVLALDGRNFFWQNMNHAQRRSFIIGSELFIQDPVQPGGDQGEAHGRGLLRRGQGLRQIDQTVETRRGGSFGIAAEVPCINNALREMVSQRLQQALVLCWLN